MGKLFRKVSSLTTLAMLCAIFAVSAHAQRSTISGFVLGSDQRPVSQITVELRSEYNSVLSRIRTDGSGRFYFTNLSHGRYSVKALPFGTGYTEASIEVEITGTGARGQSVADNIQKDIYLRPRKNANATPFKNAVIYAQEVPREAEVLYKDAVSDLERDRAQSGIVSLEKAVEMFPTYFVALQRLGAVRLGQEKYEDAIAIFNRAIAVNDRSFDCWYGLAYAQYALRQFKESGVSSEKAVLLRPDSMEATLLLGMNQRILKDLAGAEKTLKKAVKLAEGTSPDVHWQLALLYGKEMNKFTEAAKELEQYLELSPDAPNREDIKKLIKQFKEKAKSGE